MVALLGLRGAAPAARGCFPARGVLSCKGLLSLALKNVVLRQQFCHCEGMRRAVAMASLLVSASLMGGVHATNTVAAATPDEL